MLKTCSLKSFVAVCSAALVTVISMAAQSIRTQADMHERVARLYSFSPHSISGAARDEKSKQMDAFWEEVKAHQQSELPLLRVELANAANPAFFMVDGSNLLLSLSHVRPDEELAAAAMARSDLADVDPGAYFYAIHALSVDGIDTTRAALHILDDPHFAVPVPQHAMTLDQKSALVYLLLPVTEDKWIGAARARFATEKSDPAEESLLNLFFYAQTRETDALINAASLDATKSSAVRESAKHYQEDAREALKAKFDIKGTEAEIRDARQKRMRAVSDEAIDDMQEMIGRLVQLRNQKH